MFYRYLMTSVGIEDLHWEDQPVWMFAAVGACIFFIMVAAQLLEHILERKAHPVAVESIVTGSMCSTPDDSFSKEVQAVTCSYQYEGGEYQHVLSFPFKTSLSDGDCVRLFVNAKNPGDAWFPTLSVGSLMEQASMFLFLIAAAYLVMLAKSALFPGT